MLGAEAAARIPCVRLDEKGRAFVVETYRRRTSVRISEKHGLAARFLAMRTVEDRVAFLHKALAPR